MEQLALIVKVQATIRGYLTRKKVRIVQMNMGMGAHYYDPEVQVNEDYDNPKVQVSLPPPKDNCLKNIHSNNYFTGLNCLNEAYDFNFDKLRQRYLSALQRRISVQILVICPSCYFRLLAVFNINMKLKSKEHS